jgi:hypothetical protein
VTLLHEVSLFFVYGYKKLISIIDSRDVINAVVHKAIKLPEVEVEVEVNLRPTVSRPGLSWCQAPFWDP